MQTSTKSNLQAYLLIGFLQGAAGWFGTNFWPDGNQLLASLILGLMIAIAVVGLAFQLVLSNRPDKQVCLLSVALGALFAIISVWLIYQIPEKSEA